MRESKSRVEDDGSITVAPLKLLDGPGVPTVAPLKLLDGPGVPTWCIIIMGVVKALNLWCSACQHSNCIIVKQIEHSVLIALSKPVYITSRLCRVAEHMNTCTKPD